MIIIFYKLSLCKNIINNKSKKKSFSIRVFFTSHKTTAKLRLFFDMCNKDLFFRDFGNGKPIIILHGIMGSSDFWIPTAKVLSDKYRVLIPDLPNHGNSLHTNTLDYQSMANIIEEFAVTNNIEKPIIIGHSYGGKIALQMTKKNNIDIEKIVVIDITSGKQDSKNIEKMIKILSLPLPFISSYEQASKYFASLTDDQNTITLLSKGLKREGKQLRWKWNTELLCRQYSQILQPTTLPTQCHIPLLLIKGELSDYITPSGIRELQNSFTQVKVASVANAGHWVHTDNFDDFISTIESFL